MPLLECPDCQKKFSDSLADCPECGCPTAEAALKLLPAEIRNRQSELAQVKANYQRVSGPFHLRIEAEPKQREEGRLKAEPKRVSLDLKEGGNLVLAPIPAGAFLMGSPATEDGRDDDETQHRVTITKPFYLGIYPVTQAQYEAVMAVIYNISFFKGATLPVEMVNWNDAVEFCQKLSQNTGRNFRLPTEAEWEYACRAGTTAPFYFGNTISTDQANYDGNSTYGSGVKGVYRQKTTPVGMFPANAWGLYDMHGNVWEWCSDWFEEYPKRNIIDPQGAINGTWRTDRASRGGSWDTGPRNCRSANRRGYGPGSRDVDCGFRVALDWFSVAVN